MQIKLVRSVTLEKLLLEIQGKQVFESYSGIDLLDTDWLKEILQIVLAIGVTELVLSGCDAKRYTSIMNTLQKHGVVNK